MLAVSLLGWLGWEKLFVSPVALAKEFFVKGVVQDASGAGGYRVLQEVSFPTQGFLVTLLPKTYYRVCLPISRASAATSVVVDVAGRGYDNAEQEHRFSVEKSFSLKDYCFIFDSETPPVDTGLRVMFDGVGGIIPGALEFSKPRLEVVSLPELALALKLVSLLSITFVSLLSVWMGAKAFVLERPQISGGKLIVGALWLLAPTVVCVALWAAFSSTTPWVFGDEYTYAWLSKHGGDLVGAAKVGLVSTIAHSFVYFRVYGIAFMQHADPYVVVKAINVFFWLGSAGVAYIAARRVLPSIHSAVFAVCVISGPWMIYTRVFMPEVMYYFGFWCCVAIFLWLWKTGSLRGELALGLALGCLSLVKSHALFLLPGFAIGAMAGHAFSGRADKRLRALMVIFSGVALSLSWYLSKLLLTYFFGHATAGGGLAGGYGGELDRIASVFSGQQRLLSVLEVLVRHAGISVIATGGALAVAGAWVIRKIRTTSISGQSMAPEELLGVVVMVSALVSLAVLLSITALFTVSVAGLGPAESVTRTHTRYYGFILPFVLLAGMCAAKHIESSECSRGLLNRVLWGVCVLFGFGALLVQASWLNANDGPDALLYSIPVLGWIAVSSYVIVTGVYCWGSARIGVLVIGAWGVFIGLANVGVYAYRYYEMTSVVSAGEAVGVAAAFHVRESERDEGLVLTKDVPIDLYRLMFHLNGRSPVQIESDCRAAMLKAKGEGRRWVITYGYSEECAQGYRFDLLGKNVKLYRLSGMTELPISPEARPVGGANSHEWVFGKSTQIRLVSAHAAESWGVWIPPEGYFELAQPVDGRVTVVLHAHGFGPNVGRKITAVLGARKQTFVLSDRPEKHVLNFTNISRASSLKFEGLEGKSPKEAGKGEDSRILAMGIVGATVLFGD